MCKGFSWKLPLFDDKGEVLRISEIVTELLHIQRESAAAPEGGDDQFVSMLSIDTRDTWAENRSRLMSLSKSNCESLRAVEEAIFVLVLEDCRPGNLSECAHIALSGGVTPCWADKSWTAMFSENGYVMSHADHTPFDAMTPMLASKFQKALVKDLGKVRLFTDALWPESLCGSSNRRAALLCFQMDEHLRGCVTALRSSHRQRCDAVLVCVRNFTEYGRLFMKRHNLHPDAYVQMALQLAYARSHGGRLAPTYETATTRTFYRGRTETIRSCTVEAADFVRRMIGGEESTLDALRRACERHVTLMRECGAGGAGVDRHLLALYLTAVGGEGGTPPALFTHSSYAATGGGGNYVLSTSTMGFSDSVGGAAPMVPHGYGAFYSMLDDQVTLFVTAYRETSPLTAQQFSDAVFLALRDMRELVEGGVLQANL